ncbi:MAG: hypothetical protein AAGF68_00005 [Pseudomonadota bacterium]
MAADVSRDQTRAERATLHLRTASEFVVLSLVLPLAMLVCGAAVHLFARRSDFELPAWIMDIGLWAALLLMAVCSLPGLYHLVQSVSLGAVRTRSFRQIATLLFVFLFGMLPWGAGALVAVFQIDSRVVRERNDNALSNSFVLAFRDGTLFLDGHIGVQSAAAFVDALEAHDVERVIITSRGGLTTPAVAMRDAVREAGAIVRVETFCASACLTVLAGGVTRELGVYGQVRCHRGQDGGLMRRETTDFSGWLGHQYLADAAAAAVETSVTTALSPPTDDPVGRAQESVQELCANTPHDGATAITRHQLGDIGLVTHFQREPDGPFREGSGHGLSFFDSASLAAARGYGNGVGMFHDLYRFSLLDHASHPDLSWNSNADPWIARNADALGEFFGVTLPEPLCLTQAEFDQLYDDVQAELVEQEEFEYEAPQEAVYARLDQISVELNQAVGCPTTGYRRSGVPLDPAFQ